MDDIDLREVFSSLCTLAEQGPLPVQAYSVLVRRMCPDALGEQLHRGWLADHRFAPTAANIILHVSTAEERDVALSSCCLALILNDFRGRHQMREESRGMYRNCVRALFHMYPVYKQLDACVSKCFVQPMFTYLEELFSEDVEDLEVAGTLLCDFGHWLWELRSLLVERLILRVRGELVSDSPALTQHHRRIFLHALDLHTHGWNELLIPEHLITGVLLSPTLHSQTGNDSQLGPYVRPKRLRAGSLPSLALLLPPAQPPRPPVNVEWTANSETLRLPLRLRQWKDQRHSFSMFRSEIRKVLFRSRKEASDSLM